MADPKPIFAVTQFTGGIGAKWRDLTVPLPDGVLSFELDTGVIKRGDGVSLYADLPVFFNAKYLQDVANSVQAALDAQTAAAASATVAALHAQQAELGSKVSGTTTDTTQTPLAGMGTIPDGIAVQRVVGQVMAQNTATGDLIVWDISGVAVRRGFGLNPAMPIEPAVTVYYADTDMVGCTLSLTVSNLGLVLTAVGLATTLIAWNGNLIFSGTPASS